jgi:hypothetical protein
MPASISSCACWHLTKRRGSGISAGLGRRRLPSTTSGSSSCAGGVVVLATSTTSGAAAYATSAASSAVASAAAAGSAGGGSAMASSVVAAAAAGVSIIVVGPAVSSWGRLRALGVWRHLAPDLWVWQLLVLARAEPLLELSPTPQQGKMKVLAGAGPPSWSGSGGRARCVRRMGPVISPTWLGPQKANEKMKSSEKTTYTKSYHSQPPWATGATFLPAKDPPDLWWWSPAAGASSGGGGVCGLGSVGGGGIAGRRVVGGGGGICCSGEGRRASSGLPSDCWRCDGGGGALLCLSASTVF